MPETLEAPAPVADMSYAQIRAAINGDESPAPTEAAVVAAPETPVVPETPAAPEETAKPAPAPEPEVTEEPEVELPKGVQKRIEKEIARAVKARGDAERFRDELAAKLQETAPAKAPAAEPAQTGKPKPKSEDFPIYDDFLENLADWKLDQREAARAQAELAERTKAAQTASMEAWQTRAKILRIQFPDFDAVLKDANVAITPNMNEAILTSDAGPAIAYHLAQNPDECKRIAALPPIAAVRELGKLEATLTAPAPAAPQTPTPPARKPLPKPPVVVAGAPSPEIDLDKADMKTFKREIQKHIAL